MNDGPEYDLEGADQRDHWPDDRSPSVIAWVAVGAVLAGMALALWAVS